MMDLNKIEREHNQWAQERAQEVLTKEQLLCAEKTGYPVCHLTGQCQFFVAPQESEAFERCMKAHGQDFFGKPIQQRAVNNGKESPAGIIMILVLLALVVAFLFNYFKVKL